MSRNSVSLPPFPPEYRASGFLLHVTSLRQGGRGKLGCIILGRGEDDRNVREWLTTAAAAPGFIGFDVGRTAFWEPLVNWRAKEITREAAAAEIARRYRGFVDVFESAHVETGAL